MNIKLFLMIIVVLMATAFSATADREKREAARRVETYLRAKEKESRDKFNREVRTAPAEAYIKRQRERRELDKLKRDIKTVVK